MKEYKYMNLFRIRQYEQEMELLKVSLVARSKVGFLTYYKSVGGNPMRVSDFWKKKRNGFIARTLAAYKMNPTERRKLSLIAWAYNPD